MTLRSFPSRQARSAGLVSVASRWRTSLRGLSFRAVSFYDAATANAAMHALNFYSPLVADQLRSHRKTATIRLGDKSDKYRKGEIVQVLCGARFSPREKVFDAVIDKVEVKRLRDLSPREIEHDNPELRRADEMAEFLSQLYNRDVLLDDTVTVIRFSEIRTTR
jgi:hypothetical protein